MNVFNERSTARAKLLANRAAAYLALGDASGAMKDATETIDMDARFVIGHCRLTAAHLFRGEPRLALAACDRGLSIDAQNAKLLELHEVCHSVLHNSEQVQDVHVGGGVHLPIDCHQPPTRVRPAAIGADLELRCDDDGNDEEEGAEEHTGAGRSVMSLYLEAIQGELQRELSTRDRFGFSPPQETWLLDYLVDHEFIISCREARRLCERLKHDFTERAYYRDVHVWLPDVRYGRLALPCCPYCKSTKRVGVHGWRSDHFGRRVVDLTSCYYIMSRRYKCHQCFEDLKEHLGAATRVAQAHGAQVLCGGDDKQERRYTFMGYHPVSVAKLPYGLGDSFPAFLTHRGAVDMGIIDLERPLFNTGVRPHTMSGTLLELHSKHYYKASVEREQLIAMVREHAQDLPVSVRANVPSGMFSEFADARSYGGKVPSSAYLQEVYIRHGETLREFFDREVKKRGALYLAWDASYKEAGHLAMYHGHAIFKALITATNEHVEIRIQFHVVSDSQDQLVEAVNDFLATSRAYGQEEPALLFTDKPMEDKRFFLQHMPSLQATQDKLDHAFQPAENRSCSMNGYTVQVLKAPRRINVAVAGIRYLLQGHDPKFRVISLDAEWGVRRTGDGPFEIGKVAVIQLAYFPAINAPARAVVLHVHGQSRLPSELCALFADPCISFAGVGVGGDLQRIADSFGNFKTDAVAPERQINLGAMAAKRGVSRAVASLASLVSLVLYEDLSKDSSVRMSTWSCQELCQAQIEKTPSRTNQR